MNVIVRFYWQHDLDLVALNMHPDFDMGRQMKRAITAYARSDWDFNIPLPRSMPYSVELGNCCTHFRLSPEKDADVIAFLNGFRSGFRNSAIKIIFRKFLQGIYIEPFFNQQTYLTKSRSHVNNKETMKVNIPKQPIQEPRYNPPKQKEKVISATESVNRKTWSASDTAVPAMTESNFVEEDNLITGEKHIDDADSNDDEFDIFGAINLMMK